MESLPSHSLSRDELRRASVVSSWPPGIDRAWAFGDADGSGVRVCVIDSGIEDGHALVGEIKQSVTLVRRVDGEIEVEGVPPHDAFGHGTACAGIIRSIAPHCELTSVRVLGADNRGSGQLMAAGLEWAIEQRFDVINLSLATPKQSLVAALARLIDDAYFNRSLVVASAHNQGVPSFPWQFSSVISVGSHELADPLAWAYNPTPPVEFFARGVDLDVAWLGGGTLRSSGNSFAAAHMSGICARIRSKHPELTPFEVKHLLHLTAENVTSEQAVA